jgi:O-antigen/teichoic acid export membrane protein
VLFVEYLILGVQVITSYVINHKFGIKALGIYALVLAIAQISMVGTSQPFSSLIRRDFVVGNFNIQHYLRTVNKIRFIILVIILAIILLLLPFIKSNSYEIIFFLILVIICKGFDMLNDGYFVAYQSLSAYKYYALLKIGYAFIFLVTLAYVFFFNVSIVFFYWSQLFVGLFYFILNFFLFKMIKEKEPGKFIKEGAIISSKQLLKEIWPMIVNSLVSQGSTKLNAIIIYHILSAKDLGIFSVLLMFANIFAGVGNSIGIIMISRFSILLNESIIKFKIFFKKSLLLFFGVGILLAIAYAVFLPFLLKYYNFPETNLLLLNILMGISIPFLFTTSCISNIFLILKNQISGMYVSIIVLLISLVLFVTFSTLFGLIGAGYAFALLVATQLIIILIKSFQIIKTMS